VRLFVAKIHETNAASLHLFRKLGYREVDYSHAFREHEFRFEMTAAPHMEYELYVNEDEA